MAWKIILQIAAVLIAVLIANLDYLWHDKGTHEFKRTRVLLYLVLAITLVISIVVTIQDACQQRQLTSRLDSLKNDTVAFRKEAKASGEEQQSKMQSLIEGNKKLQDALAPFESIAKQRHPDVATDIALTKLQSDITRLESKTGELEQAAKKAARGVSSHYDFNGAKRETSARGTSVVAGEECVTFQRLVHLAKQRDYKNLLQECEKAIQKTPDWLTPYLFQGIAQVTLGDRKAAIISLQYVVDSAPGDPDYAQAEELLRKMKEQ